MKGVIYIGAFLFLGAMALTSCKKDWTCDCTVNGQTTSIPIENQTKSDAKDACDSGISVNGVTVSSDCKLK